MVQDVPDDNRHLDQRKRHHNEIIKQLRKQDAKTTIVIILTSAAILISVISIFLSSMDDKVLQQSIVNQTEIDLLGQKTEKENFESLQITMDEIKNSLSIDSIISLKVFPHEEKYGSLHAVTKWSSSSEGVQREVITSQQPYVLIDGDTVQFDIIVTNVGSDTVFLNYYGTAHISANNGSRTLFQKNIHPNGTDLNHQINDFLEPQSKALLIPYWLKIDSNFSPSGKIFFEVFYENSESKSFSIDYKYKAKSLTENP